MVATVIPATRAQPFVKKGCPSQCGSVTIPYPFSTKEGCFLNHNFYIHCDESIACLAHMKLIITDCDRRSVAGLNHGCSRLLPSWSIMLLVLVLTISWIYRGLWPKRLIKQRLLNGGIILQQQLSKFNGAVSAKVATGTVYKGILCDNHVAVKKSMIADHSQVEQFSNEVIVLSQVNNRNVLKLFRSLETEVPLLVYEFIVNGTLYEQLQSSGLIFTQYLQSSQLAEKSDVYSFRVVLAELLTGRKALCVQMPEEQRNLAMHYVSTLKKDQLFRIIDHHVLVEGNTTRIQVAMLANRCLRVKGKERPSMKEVATGGSKSSSSDYGSC
ncbi:hypothetical protein GOBAR_AA23340 [Gossypium barbadense]|uniref:Serine-threonine/tyrosine-protein kinase catalytic domain-containing protein n=1 Tax=Gossypium barbadense TaxID=3634 RepID=A0A2P5X1V5_GOSBA|nr:hypothetical protein GOBAR_AA23340 [Gossypium barbadense]